MFFPAGIPIVAVVALIIWNVREEAKRAEHDRESKRS
jgi:hypothetical protein